MQTFIQYHVGAPEVGSAPYHARSVDDADFPQAQWNYGTVVVASYKKHVYDPLSNEDLRSLQARLDAQYDGDYDGE